MSNLFEQLAIVKEELRKLEEMLHGNMLKLPWDEAPEWAQWVAMDQSNHWYWYALEPILDPSYLAWQVISGEYVQFDLPPCTNWKESKRKRL